MELNEKQKVAFDKVLEGRNLFISGPGGVGKSFLIKKIMDVFEDSTLLLAPTGIAALNIGGATIHSVFRFPLNLLTKGHHGRVNSKVGELFDKDGPVRRIIIDEISMTRQDVFMCIDEHLKRARRDSRPFGGLQVIVVGDFFQLPPVITRNEEKEFFKYYESPFAFGGETWSRGQFEYIELDQIMRQSDEVFVGHLQKIRKKEVGFNDSVKFFNSVATNNMMSVLERDPVFLCTVNAVADKINADHFEELEGEVNSFKATISGEFKERPAPFVLDLKYGTKVMMTANTDEFKNGSIGYVTGFLGDRIEVTLENPERTIFVEKFTWENLDYVVSGDELKRVSNGKYTQYPMKLAWACTVHKSQGLSLDSAVIDPGRGFFASGQLYVALSRLRTLEGLAFTSPINSRDVIVDNAILEFYNNECRGIGL